MDYSVQYEETAPGHIEVTLTTADGDEVAKGSVPSLADAHQWATEQATAFEAQQTPPEPLKGSFDLTLPKPSPDE